MVSLDISIQYIRYHYNYEYFRIYSESMKIVDKIKQKSIMISIVYSLFEFLTVKITEK